MSFTIVKIVIQTKLQFETDVVFVQNFGDVIAGIIERAVVINGSIVIRPMMYIALSYDHRIIDGKEAVSFLKNVKDCLEDPKRLFLDL